MKLILLQVVKQSKYNQLDGLEHPFIDGNKYEAFNTIVELSPCVKLPGKVKTMSYKTIRYPTIHASMKFLLEDPNLKHNKEKFIDLFDQEVPILQKRCSCDVYYCDWNDRW